MLRAAGCVVAEILVERVEENVQAVVERILSVIVNIVFLVIEG